MSDNENDAMNEDASVDNTIDINLPTVEQIVEENKSTNGKRKRKDVSTKEKKEKVIKEKVSKEKSSLTKGFKSFKDENKKEKTILIDNGLTVDLNGNYTKNNKAFILLEGKQRFSIIQYFLLKFMFYVLCDATK